MSNTQGERKFYTIKDIEEMVKPRIIEVEQEGNWVAIWLASGVKIKIPNF